MLEIAREIRQASEVPLLLFSYLNPILRYGVEALAQDAAAAGIDGCLITDLSVEEADVYTGAMHAHGLDTVFLAAPTSTPRRLALVAKYSTGFVYLVSRTGVTGERNSLSGGLEPLVESVRKATSLPLAVGFGISTPEQVRQVGVLADAAVVGSAFVRMIERNAAECFASGATGVDGARAEARLRVEKHMKREDALLTLEDCRRRIDDLDLRILALLNERTRAVEQIGQAKQSLDLPIYEPRREDEVYANVTGHNSGPLPAEAVKRIFERIIDEMRTVQKRADVRSSRGKFRC